jgi:outer membrane protein assembly factor BamB
MRHGQVRRESLLYVVVAATRPRYCGVLLVAALWLTAGLVCPHSLGAQRAKRMPPPPPFASLFPLEEAWTVALPTTPVAPPARDASRVFVPIASGLVALDWETGDRQWSIALTATSAPWPSNGALYVAEGTMVHALDAASGAARWMAQASGAVRLVRLAGARLIAVGNTAIQAFDGASGAPVWTRPLDDAGEPVGIAALGDALIVSFARGVVRRVAPGDGSVAWTHMLDGRLSPPLLVKDTVYVGSTTNRFYALDVASGKERWQWRTGGDVIGAAVDGTARPKAVYYASLDAVVRAVNPGNGHQRWKRDGGTRAVAPPLALDGSVVVAGLTPALSAFTPLTGAPQGTFALPGEIHGTPLVTDTLVPRTVAMAVVLKDGRVFGLRALSLMFNETAPQPLLALPGKPLLRDRLP